MVRLPQSPAALKSFFATHNANTKLPELAQTRTTRVMRAELCGEARKLFLFRLNACNVALD